MGIQALEHDHTQLTRAIAELRARAKSADPGILTPEFIGRLRGVADELIEHFALEEEGLFPFILDALPEQAQAVTDLQAAHDRICGIASRLASLEARPGSEVLALALFDRFDAEYTAHAQRELEFLRTLGQRMTPAQHERLHELLAEI